MSTQIFLGPPPPHVEAWMKEHYQKWVPAVYTDEWLADNGKTYQVEFIEVTDPATSTRRKMWVISGGNSGCETGVFSQDTVELTYPSLYNGNADNTNVELYRVFTPGHWEDADGNWINGSWDSETEMTAIYDPNDIKCEWLHKGQEIYGTIIKESAWYMGVSTGLTNNNRNANIIYTSHPTEDGYFETFSWHRTWTNTKTEPNN